MNLERLDLSVNNISNLAALASLRHLSVLNLSSNKISNLGECFFFLFFSNAMISLFLQYVPCLNHLFIQIYPDTTFCFLSSEESLRSCENIQNLNLAGNLISRYLK